MDVVTVQIDDATEVHARGVITIATGRTEPPPAHTIEHPDIHVLSFEQVRTEIASCRL